MPDGVRTQFLGYDFNTTPTDVRPDVFIPRDRIRDVLPQLATGDVCLVMRKYTPARKPISYDCDHLGIIVRTPDDTVMLLHSAPPKVRQETLAGFLEQFPRVAGFKFLRTRDDAFALVTAELARVGTAIAVRAAADEDQRARVLRARRGGR